MRYIFLVNVGLGMFMVSLAVPMLMRWVRPNAIYGFRTAKTLSSESVWYAANRFAGASLVGAGLVIAAISIALFRSAGLAASKAPWSPDTMILMFLGALFVPLLCSVTASLLYVRRL